MPSNDVPIPHFQPFPRRPLPFELPTVTNRVEGRTSKVKSSETLSPVEGQCLQPSLCPAAAVPSTTLRVYDRVSDDRSASFGSRHLARRSLLPGSVTSQKAGA